MSQNQNQKPSIADVKRILKEWNDASPRLRPDFVDGYAERLHGEGSTDAEAVRARMPVLLLQHPLARISDEQRALYNRKTPTAGVTPQMRLQEANLAADFERAQKAIAERDKLNRFALLLPNGGK
jgi:hypothetical protein